MQLPQPVALRGVVAGMVGVGAQGQNLILDPGAGVDGNTVAPPGRSAVDQPLFHQIEEGRDRPPQEPRRAARQRQGGDQPSLGGFVETGLVWHRSNYTIGLARQCLSGGAYIIWIKLTQSVAVHRRGKRTATFGLAQTIAPAIATPVRRESGLRPGDPAAIQRGDHCGRVPPRIRRATGAEPSSSSSPSAAHSRAARSKRPFRSRPTKRFMLRPRCSARLR